MNNQSQKIVIASHSPNLIALTNSDVNNEFLSKFLKNSQHINTGKLPDCIWGLRV